MALSIASILAESALRHPQRTALLFGDQRITYTELWTQSGCYASVLAGRGIRAGGRVALMMPNVPHFPRAYYAILALGAVVVPVHALLLADEVAYLIRDSDVKLFIGAGMLPEGLKGAQQCGVDALSVLDGPPVSQRPAFANIACLDELAATESPIETYAQRDAADDAVILFTSGTTGKPKGAVLSNANVIMNVDVAVTDLFDFNRDDVFLGSLPLFHSFGQTLVMNTAFRVGASIALLPRFDGAAALELLVGENATVFMGVPTMYIALLEAAKTDPRRPALRIAAAGGASLPVAVLEQFETVFGTPVYEGYGLSETSPVASFNQKAFGRKPGTVGCGIWDVDVRIALAELEDRIEFVASGEI